MFKSSAWKRSLFELIAVSQSAFFILPVSAAVRKDPPASIRGAVYVPSNAYNAPQLWKNFSLDETRRDFGYARHIRLNAFRVWASYEFWQKNPEKFQSEFDQMLKEELVTMMKAALEYGKKTGLPVWMTEWQRLRTSGTGFGNVKISPAERGTDYASIASTVHDYPVGNFFWCLMVKRAYLRPQRFNGTVNGLFWPDGSVTSLKDAQAIANDPKLKLKEKTIPADFGNEAVE